MARRNSATPQADEIVSAVLAKLQAQRQYAVARYLLENLNDYVEYAQNQIESAGEPASKPAMKSAPVDPVMRLRGNFSLLIAELSE